MMISRVRLAATATRLSSVRHILRISSLQAKALVRAASSDAGVTPFILADIGEGIAEVEMLQWFVKEGDKLQQFDPVCEVQSDKATVEITSRFDGVVLALHHEVGHMVPVGSALIDISTAAEEQTSNDESIPLATPEPIEIETQGSSVPSPHHNVVLDERVKRLATPAVRKIAKERGIDLSRVTGTGPKGRVLKHDVLIFDTAAPPAPPAPSSSGTSGGNISGQAEQANTPDLRPSPTTRESPPRGGVGGASSAPVVDRTEKISGIRRAMFRTMTESLRIPHFGYGDEVNASGLVITRTQLNEARALTGEGKLSFMPIILKAASLALIDFPIMNSSISADETEIIFHSSHNLGVAMDTEKGLLVPVVQNVQDMSILDIHQRMTELKELGMSGELGEKHLTGATFTISNIGNIGGNYMSPIIMPPQVAICALGKMRQELRRSSNDPSDGGAGDDEGTWTPVMQMAFAGDHRILDGATVARFAEAFKAYMEDPITMLSRTK